MLTDAPKAGADFRAFASAGPLVLPFDRPKDGAVEFLWDGWGRPLECRVTDGVDALRSSFSCRYDKRGLLVEEDIVAMNEAGKAASPTPAATAPPTPAATAAPMATAAVTPFATQSAPSSRVEASLFFFYRLDAKGGWLASSAFIAPSDSQPGGPIPHGWFAREGIAIPPAGATSSPPKLP